MTLRLSDLAALAAIRPPGFMEDVLSHAVMDGEAVELSEEDYEALQAKYARSGQSCCGG